MILADVLVSTCSGKEGILLGAKEAVQKVTGQTISLLEKATEIRFFLHALCIALYLQLTIAAVLGEAASAVAWSEFESLSPAKLLALVIGYFALMGYVFRVIYAFVSYGLRWLNVRFSLSSETRWRDIRGMVHEDDVVHHAYVLKDSELTRQLEAHKEVCRQDRKELGDLAYLSFAALVLIGLNHYLGRGGFIEAAQAYLKSLLGANVAQALNAFLLLPLFMIIWLDISADYDRERYLKHDPLYEEIKRQKGEAGHMG